MTEREFLATIRSHTARAAIGASTVRGKGNVGVVLASRCYLREMNLRPFGTTRSAAFNSALDQQTESLRKSLPVAARHWGIARKVINIYLRNSLYTSYLCDAYHLGRAESLMELPLDSYTAKALKKLTGSNPLPRWNGVKHVTANVNAQFQKVAAAEAKARGVARVHFDALWWSADRD